ncbi:hypothetical protein RFN58_28835 [Streptomyces iakyrus]|uniref:hypothetical protein n=1 Tax=Streptomyces iakyrus TaxID=68219 RepID=UPI0012FEC561|nr:hypothetical protein [Streptomyces iakyrus]
MTADTLPNGGFPPELIKILKQRHREGRKLLQELEATVRAAQVYAEEGTLHPDLPEDFKVAVSLAISPETEKLYTRVRKWTFHVDRLAASDLPRDTFRTIKGLRKPPEYSLSEVINGKVSLESYLRLFTEAIQSRLDVINTCLPATPQHVNRVTRTRGGDAPNFGRSARILDVMIASPSNPEALKEVERIKNEINSWNSNHSLHWGIHLHPMRWEVDAPRDYGIPAQSTIDREVLERAHILLAVFWGYAGRPTEEAISGTVGEITKANDQGKPVKVYIADKDLPKTTTAEQLVAFRAMESKLKKHGLVGYYDDTTEAKKLESLVRFDLNSYVGRYGRHSDAK